MVTEVLGHGVYSFSEAARLVGSSRRRVRTWFVGAPDQQRLVQGDYACASAPGGVLSFLDLIDVCIVSRLRAKNISLQYIRKVHDVLLDEFSQPHPFSRRGLFTDSARKKVFLHVADDMGEERLRELLSGQHAFPSILLPVLDQVDYDPSSLLARRWNMGSGVTIDPARQYGKPIVESAGIPTSVLAAAFYANEGNAHAVAKWYGVDVGEVRTAVHFEQSLDTGRHAA